MTSQDDVKFNMSETDALCVMTGDTLVLQPLATTRYLFEAGMITGDMVQPGVCIAEYNMEEQRLTGGGVMTRQQVIALRDFLNDFINRIKGSLC